MAALGKPGKNTYGNVRRVSPLKPGLRGAKNWASAQIRSASYNPKHKRRLVFGSLALSLFIVWAGLWLGGFMPQVKAGYHNFTKQRLIRLGFVVRKVDVVGEGRVREEKVKAMLGVRQGDFLYDMDIRQAQARIERLSWVETAVVRRLWPDRIVVHINERRPYALWQEHRKLHVIDRNGVLIKQAEASDFVALPFVVGQGASDKAGPILKAMGRQPDLEAQTEALVYVGKRRWDILLKDGTRILLPEHRPDLALQRFETYNRTHHLLALNVKTIDMRLKDRITFGRARPPITPRA